MHNWVLINRNVALAIHEELLAEHGGPVGVRDAAMLESALGRPQEMARDNQAGETTVADLAAAYACGIIQVAPFVDGNLQTGFALLELCLRLNSFELLADDTSCITKIQEVASGIRNEHGLSEWIYTHLKPDCR